MNWMFSIPDCLLISLITGVYLVKDHAEWTWSLNKRAYLRNGMVSSIINRENLERMFRTGIHEGFTEKISKTLRKNRERKMDKEIFESITFLRNLASIDKKKVGSADYIVEKLSEYQGLLQPVFIKMLNLLHVNQPKEAAELFAQKVGTDAGREFAGLLIRWDNMEPSELTEILLSYEKSMKAIRITEQKRKDEIISDLIYFPVVVNILVIFVNFIYVAYFIDQKEMLKMFM